MKGKDKRFHIVSDADFDTCVYWLRKNILNLKVQYSSGKEIKSSCGMFSDYKA